MSEEGISHDTSYTDITDAALDQLIKEIKEQYPNHGERMLIGELTQRGVILQRARIRAAIHRIDPINTAIRRSVALRRRVYHVDGPNSVWHIDGHHKLIRWRLVTHGGIDGYSRTITYLKCSNNNRAETVKSSFFEATQYYGIPQKVRSDMGGENEDVWKYMIEYHSDISAVITGSSTHNERIERLWRDVHRCVTSIFYALLYKLEDESLLDTANEVDMFCIHYVFIRRINRALKSFMESWNNHSLSSAQSHTPNQLFIEGAIQQSTVPVIPPPASSSPSNLSSPVAYDHVTVPNNRFSPCNILGDDIRSIDVLQTCDDFGYSIFKEILEKVGSHLSSGCTDCVINDS